MKLTPLQARLVNAYTAAPTERAVVSPSITTKTPEDRVELSEQAKAHLRIRARLVGGSVSVPAMPEAAARSPESQSMQLHQTPAAVNAAATGVAVGRTLDTTA